MREEDCVVGARVVCTWRNSTLYYGMVGTILKVKKDSTLINFFDVEFDFTPGVLVGWSCLSSFELYQAPQSLPETQPRIPVSTASPKVYRGECPCGLKECCYHEVLP